MKYCKHCGKKIEDEAIICIHCGRKLTDEEDKSNTLYNVLAFFLPIVGLILYIADKDKKPIQSKEVLKWTAIGFILSIALPILLFGCLSMATVGIISNVSTPVLSTI